MKDDKNKTAVEKLNSANDFSNGDLNDELDRLAETFREELKKAQADAELSEKMGEMIQGLDVEEEIDEDDLCSCCGERKRDKSVSENYEYCAECREAMKHYPLSGGLVAVLVAMIAAAVISMIIFVGDFSGYNGLKKAEAEYKNRNLNTAVQKYDEAISVFEANGINAKKAYYNSACALMDSMPNGVVTMREITSRLSEAVNSFEAKMPIYGKYGSLSDEAAVAYATLALFNDTLSTEEFAGFDGKDEETYQKMMAAIDVLTGSDVLITHLDGTSEKVPAEESVVRFAQYMFAYSTSHLEDAKKYLQLTAEKGPQYLWMYAYEMGCVELQTGSRLEAKKYADLIYKNNKEAVESYSLYSSIERMSGKTEKAVEWADKGLAISEGNADLLRVKGMAYIADGKYEKAKEVLAQALEDEEYGLLYFTYYVALNELGDTEAAETAKKAYTNLGLEFTDRMNKYLSGKLTATQLFTEGTGDVE